jgi:starch synthase
MDIALVTPEIAPYSRWTSADEASAALPKALRGLGHKVTVISPLWASIDTAARHLGRRLVKIEVDAAGTRHALALFDGRSTGGVELQFLSEDSLFPRNAASTDVGPDTAVRWGAFARAAIELIARREAPPDVIHLVGWQTAAIAVLASEHPQLSAVPTVLTIHDVRAHGTYERSALSTFGIDERWWRLDGVEFYGKLSPLKGGIQAAARITSPSPTHAREITESAGGLEGALRARGKAVLGILDGVDVSVWNPATDPWLDSRFDAMDVLGTGHYGKVRCRTALQRDLGLPPKGDVPFVVSIGVASGAGTTFGAIAEIGPQLLRNDVQLALFCEPGSDPELVHRLHQLAARWPDRMAVRVDADVALVHRALGAADLAIVAEAHDPGAARAMQAQRYGALPVAARSGGAADAIVDCDAKLASGTGFLYDAPDAASLLGGLQRALAGHALRDAFRNVQHRAMTIDHSWDRSARLYERVYRSARPAEAGSTASEART